jgi:hypothetical protein
MCGMVQSKQNKRPEREIEEMVRKAVGGLEVLRVG